MSSCNDVQTKSNILYSAKLWVCRGLPVCSGQGEGCLDGCKRMSMRKTQTSQTIDRIRVSFLWGQLVQANIATIMAPWSLWRFQIGCHAGPCDCCTFGILYTSLHNLVSKLSATSYLDVIYCDLGPIGRFASSYETILQILQSAAFLAKRLRPTGAR